MTREEKHALIAEKIEGYKVVRQYASNRFLIEIEKDNPRYCAYVPNYSADLNLCRRAETKIGSMGLRIGYENELIRAAYVCPVAWWLITAPAEARVDAMVRLILSGTSEVHDISATQKVN